jgi:hypothetical protein
MIEQVDPREIILKTKQYEFADGLRDIQIGITLMMMGLVWFWLMYEPFWLRFMIQAGRDYGKWASMLAFLLVYCIPVAAAYGLQRLMESVRKRWLWRESGMVKASRIIVPTHINVIAVVLFIGVLVLGLKFQSLLKTGDFYVMSLLMVACGWCFGFTLAGMGVNIKVPRYIVVGVVGGLASTAIFLYQASLGGAGLITFLGWGVLLIVSGLIVLLQVWPEIKEESHAG